MEWVTVLVYNIFKNGKESDHILKTFKQKWKNIYIKKWEDDLCNFPILRTYRLFKREFVLESYLVNIKDYNLRKCLSKFRMSSHCLEIEKGRHVKPKIPEEQTRECTVLLTGRRGSR